MDKREQKLIKTDMETGCITDCPWSGIKIEEEIGYGSYSTVFQVTLDGQTYAMKQIRIPKNQEEAEAIARSFGSIEQGKEYCRKIMEDLREEIRILKDFPDHTHIVSILDDRIIETEDGYCLFLLMEYLEPFTGYEITHTLGEGDVIRLGLDICSALEECEKTSVIHCDLKPDNILVTKEGSFKLCDFGAARNLQKSIANGAISGTFSYMAPEVYHGRECDHRADLYSLGLILYRQRNRGREPFLNPDQKMVSLRDREDALNRRMNGEELPLPADASAGFAEILMKACAYDPDKRYSSAAEMKKDLLRLQNEAKLRKRKPHAAGKKRTEKEMIRAGIFGMLLLVFLFFAGRFLLHTYREYAVDYCDPGICRKLEEEYGLTSFPRLNGNGTLFIDNNEQLLCTKEGEEYPWMNQKMRIRKIVFGEEVSSIQAVYNGGVSHKDDLKAVSAYSFRNCENLREICIRGQQLVIEGMLPFQGDERIEVISCPEDAQIILDSNMFSDTVWSSADGCLMLGTTLVRCNAVLETVDDIPERTLRIAPMAFAGNQDLRKVLLPDGIEVIGACAFQDCTSLEEIRMPSSARILEEGAFMGCRSLDGIEIFAGVEQIGDMSFHGCQALAGLTISEENPSYCMEDGILYSKDGDILIWASPAVSGKLVIPEHASRIRNYAFTDCTKLEELIFPESIVQADLDLFGSNPELKSIVIPDTNPTFCAADGLIYSKSGELMVFCPRNRTGMVEIPDGTRAIHDAAFQGCGELTEVRIPDTVGQILSYAFQDCCSLASVTLPETLGMIGTDAFTGCENLSDIYYNGSKEDWETLTAHFRTGIEEERTKIHYAR